MNEVKTILPVLAYGDPLLKKVAKEIDRDYPGLQQLIDDMFETMCNAPGIGLAAPQVGKSIRLMVIDASSYADESDEYKHLKGFKKVFINPVMLEEKGKEWRFEEGCLSIPKIREDIVRKGDIRIRYYDRNFDLQEEKFDGLAARIIQHEYDHLDGILFPDRLNPLKKRLLKKKLMDISRGNIEVDYQMKFPLKKK